MPPPPLIAPANHAVSFVLLADGSIRLGSQKLKMTASLSSKGVDCVIRNELKMEDVLSLLTTEFHIPYFPPVLKSLVLSKLGVGYAIESSAFTFCCSGTFSVDDVDVNMSVSIQLCKDEKEKWLAQFDGKITIHDLCFDVHFGNSPSETEFFVATFRTETTGSVNLRGLISAVSTQAGKSIPESLDIALQEVKFIYAKRQAKKSFLCGLSLGVGFNLSDLPLVGEKMPAGTTIKVEDLQIMYASDDWDEPLVALLNDLLPDKILKLPSSELSQGVLVSGKLMVPGKTLEFDSSRKSPSLSCEEMAFKGEMEQAVLSSDIKWFKIEKQLGPVSLKRLGFAFADGQLAFAVDASLTVGPMNFTLSELTFGSSLREFKPVFGLQGFFMQMKTSGLEIGGGFLRVSGQNVDSYYGTVLAKIGSFGLRALGGNTPAHHVEYPEHSGCYLSIPESFFLYANMSIPLGGPPYLRITGFAGGFGINNLLKLPTLQDLPGYILLPGPGSKAPKEQSTAEDTIRSVLPALQAYFIPQPGQYWLAAGIAVNSFQMIDAFAVLTVSFGVDFEIAIIGSCAMTFPKEASTPIAYIEIAVMASYSQSSGLLAIQGVLSPTSYLIGPFCQISGSFAFFIWIDPPSQEGGPQKGDFFVSIGGFHPSFAAPSYYPQLARLKLNFNLLPLQVVGEGYFAITPSMFMAGLRLKATWSLKLISVWFELGVDFLIAWAPFSYEAVVFVRIGCSVHLALFTLNVSIGAQLAIWGPPFGGTATVDLQVITFTVGFGAPRNMSPTLLTWGEMKSQFLPASTSSNSHQLLKCEVSDGLIATNVEGMQWIVDADLFVIRLMSSLPVNHAYLTRSSGSEGRIPNDPAAYNLPAGDEHKPCLRTDGRMQPFNENSVWNPMVNVRPMGLNNVRSTLHISIARCNDRGDYLDYEDAFTLCPEVQNSAAALWGAYTGSTSLKEDDSLPSTLTGFTIRPLPHVPSVVNKVRVEFLLFQQHNDYRFSWGCLAVDPLHTLSAEGYGTSSLTIRLDGNSYDNKEYILRSLTEHEISNRRQDMLSDLNQCGFNLLASACLESLSHETALVDWPLVAKLGE